MSIVILVPWLGRVVCLLHTTLHTRHQRQTNVVLHGENQKRPGIAKNDNNNGTNKTTNNSTKQPPNSQ